MLGWCLVPPLRYDASLVVPHRDQREAQSWTSTGLPHSRRGVLDFAFPSKLSLAEYDFELAWESYDFATRAVSEKSEPWAKVMCMEALTSFYQREQAPSDLDASLYARRRGGVLRLREQLIVDGMTSDWKRAVRNGDYVDWKEALKGDTSADHPEVARHLMMILKRNWDLESMDSPLSLAPKRRELLLHIVDLIEKHPCPEAKDDLLDYRRYYQPTNEDKEWLYLLQRAGLTSK
ncbi:MAG: hypothetical protein EBT84_09655 [Sphingomonadaceae bacterium]|nr:hypothetical protein [Sphingomonadaceae bacterium]